MDPIPGLDLDQPPFDLLDAPSRERLQASVDLTLHPPGSTLIEAGQPSPHVLVILKGLVHAYQPGGQSGQRPFGDYGPGDVIGVWAVMVGRARLSYRAQTDTLCFLIPSALFHRLLADNPTFAAYFNEGMASKGRLAAGGPDHGEAAELMLIQVADARPTPPVRVNADITIADATAQLHERRVDCLLVEDPAYPEPGIVTRTDLLEAVALVHAPLEAEVGPLANRPLVTVDTSQALFEALIAMTERRIERVVVKDRGAITGTLGLAEVLSHFTSHSHLIGLRLGRARTLEQVTEAAQGMDQLIRALHAHGARISYVMRLVSALNTRVMGRIFDLVVPPEVRPHLCLLVMGSEGRREQLLKTDQDNALVIADDLEWDGLEGAMERFSQALMDIGYPPCPGQVMVNNPAWRMTVGGWRMRIVRWQRQTDGQASLDLSIALDARPVAGNAELFTPVKRGLMALGEDEVLLHHLARATLNFDTQLSFFGRVKSGDEGVDIKKGGIFPVVHGVRCLALRHGIAETGTFERCELLAERGHLAATLARDLQQALSALQRMRLRTQLAAIDAGGTADNFIDTGSLGRLDRETLRDALHVIKEFRESIARSFRLST
ncbi:putative nucleotidyltransferase substrate binding domain-containing protein [Luteimonas sp. MJ293]|uniref:putative nucleotidyltransferase substrate binding domain-containing protein n=1 Tax=Luteimonas sp. MJ146 TaxID=3129240 RepID=UPI0031BA0E3D